MEIVRENRLTLRGWRYWIRPIVVVVYALVLLVALPLLCIELYERADAFTALWFVAGIFVILTVPIALWTIVHHLIYFTQSELQKPIIRILWMVPIYAIDSWFAIRFPAAAIYFDTVRECYEAYVIYNFMAYLLNYLTREYELAGTLGSKMQQRHVFPFCCFPVWPMGGLFIQRCKQGVLQYTLIRPVTTIIAFICEMTETYHEGSFEPRYAWIYIMIINNASQIWAMYCLFLFYLATKEELKPIKPVAKFVCVKLVVFASFWQSIAVTVVLAAAHVENRQKYSSMIQDFLICFEMFFAAIAHHYAFSYKPFVIADHNVPWYLSIRNMFDVSDVRDDVADHVARVGRDVRPPWKKRKPKYEEIPMTERTTLLSPSSSDGELANVLGYAGASYGSNRSSKDDSSSLTNE